jgi:hypothetical protein
MCYRVGVGIPAESVVSYSRRWARSDYSMSTFDDQAQSSSLTRRVLLKLGGAGVVALVVPAEVFARRRRKRLGSHLRRASYRPLLGQRFGVGGTKTKLRLVRVEDLNVHQARSQNAFALIFRAPRGAPMLMQQVPQLYHPALGKFELLLQPGRAAAKGQPYAAIINRLHA